MRQRALNDYFESFLEKETIFEDKKVLQQKYIPNLILHREQQVDILAHILAPVLRKDKPSNVFLYGKTGTGKTLCSNYICDKLKEVADKKNIPLKIIYVNCKLKKVCDTEYRVVSYLARSMGVNVPSTGLPTDEIYNLFLREVEKEESIILLILDEIDHLVNKAGDEILYNLTRINSELSKSELSVIGISNDVRFIENIDPRVKSSLNEEEVIFPPYNAIELKDILRKRAEFAFKKGSIKDGVLEKCAAYAAREHGDARRALDLLRVAGEISERLGASFVDATHIDLAEEKIEKNRILEIVRTQPRQSQAVLYSILLLLKNKSESVETGEIFERYKEVCIQAGQNILTQRRISDLISELDMLGLINAKVISKGRYGRTRDIYVAIPDSIIDKVRDSLISDLT